jgi:hypothetical protein
MGGAQVQEDRSMSFPIGTPPGVGTGAYDVTGRAATPAAPPADAAGFARVYELEEARRRRAVPVPPIAGDRIPAEVWDEVEAAAKLFDQLQGEGRQVMFDSDRLTGKVVASLLEPNGAISNVPLTQAVDPQAAGPAIGAAPADVAALYGRFGGVA